MCSTQTKAGPCIVPGYFFTNSVLQEDCIEYVTTVPRKEYSRYVSELLDRLGYSYDMIKYRQQILDETDKQYNCDETQPFKVVTTGSKGEGTSLYFESDIDRMIIHNYAVCADYPQQFIDKEDITVFKTERQETSPGYTRLKLLRLETKCNVHVIRQSLFESESGPRYLSSQSFTSAIKDWARECPQIDRRFKFKESSGPSNPSVFNNMAADNVMCFRCFCPDILERWVSRPRRHGWPSPETIHEISLLDGHVVPVGFKVSQNVYSEWRICYSLAELHLIRKFNETQLKVYIILKKLSKSVLNPVCSEMTSYIMKNIVFWMCEANGLDRFTKDLLLDRLFDCIRYLRTCVSENNLPSYMIFERNLLAERVGIQHRQELTNLLRDLLYEGGRMLLRCDKLHDAMIVMYSTPEMFREFGEKRDKVEILKLVQWRLFSELNKQCRSFEETENIQAQDELFLDTQTHICHLIQLDVKQLEQKGKTVEEIDVLFNTRLTQLLS